MKFKFPDTGEGVTEGQFLEWKVEEGDTVKEDQVVGEAETDKAVVEIPAPSDGKVEELKAEPGDNVEVGDVIMILDTGEELSTEEEENKTADDEEEKEIEPERYQENVKNKSNSGEDVLALPKVRKLAEEKEVELSSIKTGERITEEEVLNAAKNEENIEETEKEQEKGSSNQVLATPSVRKLAREKEVELQNIEGSGRGGKITREDVLKAVENDKKDEIEEEVSLDIEGDEKRVELSNIRKTIADRMSESKFTAPHVTHFDTADVTELVELRERKKEKVEPHLTYLPFVMKAVYLAMKEHPRLNSELDEENDNLVMKAHYDFNIAVDTDKGLMMPIIEEVDNKNIVELAEEINTQAEKARNRKLSPSELDNGTFTITNIGAIGGEEFTPIINYPQAAILGLGQIKETAEVVNGEIVPRKTIKLSLSYDHRIIDGADAARFMNAVIENLEDPDKMILEL